MRWSRISPTSSWPESSCTTNPHRSRRRPASSISPTTLRLTICEGKYHQVKRMVGAAGNRVEALHRSRVGGLELPAELAPGQWRWLEAEDLARLADYTDPEA